MKILSSFEAYLSYLSIFSSNVISGQVTKNYHSFKTVLFLFIIVRILNKYSVLLIMLIFVLLIYSIVTVSFSKSGFITLLYIQIDPFFLLFYNLTSLKLFSELLCSNAIIVYKFPSDMSN